jgi:hypothetical protein
MPRLAVAFGVVIAAQACLAVPAAATAGMVCDGLDNKDVFVEMNLPRSAGSPPNWVRVGTPGKSFSTLGIDEGAAPLMVKQAFDDRQTFNIDLADSGADDALVKIRLLIAEEGDELPVYIGYVHVVGQDIYPIACIEDE